jgi:hypothetical protein
MIHKISETIKNTALVLSSATGATLTAHSCGHFIFLEADC